MRARRNGWKIIHKNLEYVRGRSLLPEGDWYYHVDAND